MTNTHPLRLVLIAGEASGDFLGASLMKALKQESSRPLEFFGMGGQLMKAEGLTSFLSYEGLNVLGLTEVFKSIPRILKSLTTLEKNIRALAPDAVITIDLQGFNTRLAKKLKKRSFPLIHYVAPTVWAWNAKRAKKIASLFDHLLCLYPFEPDYFSSYGLPVTYVGHPLACTIVEGDKNKFLKTYHLSERATYIAVLPGSRASEIQRMLPVFKEVLHRVASDIPDVHVVLPTIPDVVEQVSELLKEWDIPVTLIEDFDGRFDAYAACSVALATSGTIALELAQVGLPMVIAYRLSWMSGWLAKRLLKIKYVCLLNLSANKEIVPELLQDQCTPEAILKKIEPFLQEMKERQAQIKETKKALKTLAHTNAYASQCAAKKILEGLSSEKKRSSLF